MRSTLKTAVIGIGLLAASIAPSLAHCAWHDQQAQAAQQQTAQSELPQQTSTQ